MKPIATPSFRKRTDGIKFQAPPSAKNTFKLTNTRLNEENFLNQTTYSLDHQDVAFLHRYNSYLQKNATESLNLPILAQLMTAFELAAYLELHRQDQNYQQAKQRQQQLLLVQQQQQQQNSSSQGKTASTSSSANHHHQQQITNNNNIEPQQGALERASVILSSANLTGKLEEVTINVAEAIKRANFPQHPAVQDQKIQAKILELVKAHWLERRKATGTALLPVLRPLPYGNGVFRNQQLGESDEPFTSREIRNCLVLWRPTSATKEKSTSAVTTTTNNEDSANATLIDEEKEAKKQRRQDQKKTKKVLNDALALMIGVLEREESKLEYAQLLTAELAIARRCRHFPASAFYANNTNNNNTQQEQTQTQTTSSSSLVTMEDEDVSSIVPLIDICPFAESRRIQSQSGVSSSSITQKEKDTILKALEKRVREDEE